MESSQYYGVVVKLVLDPTMVQMSVYLSHIGDMLLGLVLLSCGRRS